MEVTQDDGLGQEVSQAPVPVKEQPGSTHERTVAERVAHQVSLARLNLIKYGAQIVENDGRLTADSSASLDLALDRFEDALLIIRTNGMRDGYAHWKGEMEREARYQEERAQSGTFTESYWRRLARDRAQEMAGVAEVMIQTCIQRIMGL